MTTTTHTTAKQHPQETHAYRIVCEGVGGFPAPDKEIGAAYFQQDGQFTVFKDADNAPVFSVRNDALLSIERVDPKQSDQAA